MKMIPQEKVQKNVAIPSEYWKWTKQEKVN